MTLKTSEEFRKVNKHGRASKLWKCAEINTIRQWIPHIDNTFTKEMVIKEMVIMVIVNILY